jgi:hypothetical protein
MRPARGLGPVCAQKLTGKPPDGRTRLPGPRLPPGLSRRPTGTPAPPLPGQPDHCHAAVLLALANTPA